LPINRSIELENYLHTELHTIEKLPPITTQKRTTTFKDPNSTRKAILMHILKKLASCFTIRDKLMA